MLYYASVFHSFLLLNNIPLHGYTTFYSCILLLMDIWVISTLGLLWKMLLWIFIQAYLVLLHFADTAFFTNWRFVQLCIKQVCWRHFPNSICSLCVSVSHFGNYHNISNCSIIIIFVMMISDLWCYYYDLLKAQMMVSIF